MVGRDGLRVRVRGGNILQVLAVLPHPYRPLALDLAVWVVSSTEGLMHVG